MISEDDRFLNRSNRDQILTTDPAGNLYTVTFRDQVIRRSLDGLWTLVAGAERPGRTDDGIPATAARISPEGLAVDSTGALYISESQRICEVGPDGLIRTILDTSTEVPFSDDHGDETELHLAVCHFPPGSSKWNKIEQRFFSAITQNWRGKPLVNHEVIINLISATTTKNGLRVESQLDTNLYPKGIKISDKQMAEVQLRREEFHGDWNCSILPRSLQAGNVIP